MTVDSSIPIIDIFAGPGGLGEGFASLRTGEGSRVFRSRLAIEMDMYAHQTLRLRSFFRQFDGQAPEAYYDYIEGNGKVRDQGSLFALYPEQGERAYQEAWRATLGKTRASKIDERIKQALGSARRTHEWVLLGGPPCQAYSLAGRSRMIGQESFYRDGRHRLYRHYLRLLAEHKPAVFVFENVKGLLSSAENRNGGSMFERILTDLRAPTASLRYDLFCLSEAGGQSSVFPLDDEDLRRYILEAELYGIPQCRHRVIVVGILAGALQFTKIPSLTPATGEITCETVISDLPKLRSGLSRQDSEERWLSVLRSALNQPWFRNLRNGSSSVADRIRDVVDELSVPETGRGGRFVPIASDPRYQSEWFADSRLRGTCNHESKAHMDTDLHRYLFVSCYGAVKGRSPKLKDFPEELLPAHENVGVGKAEVFADRFRVQIADRPATTVTSHLAKDGHYFIHWDPAQCRSLTVREAARIQCFPDNYFFEGPRTEQYKQVGNAVPPLLARQIAEVVADLLVPGWR